MEMYYLCQPNTYVIVIDHCCLPRLEAMA